MPLGDCFTFRLTIDWRRLHIEGLVTDVVLVVGIGGLAVAYALSKAGHQVKVLEKNDLSIPGGGHRVTPNFSKILRQWIGEEELKRISVRCIGSPSFNCESVHLTFILPVCDVHIPTTVRNGETVGYLAWQPAVLAETGGDFVLMHVSLSSHFTRIQSSLNRRPAQGHYRYIVQACYGSRRNSRVPQRDHLCATRDGRG